jgi:hypothetical protein
MDHQDVAERVFRSFIRDTKTMSRRLERRVIDAGNSAFRYACQHFFAVDCDALESKIRRGPPHSIIFYALIVNLNNNLAKIVDLRFERAPHASSTELEKPYRYMRSFAATQYNRQNTAFEGLLSHFLWLLKTGSGDGKPEKVTRAAWSDANEHVMLDILGAPSIRALIPVNRDDLLEADTAEEMMALVLTNVWRYLRGNQIDGYDAACVRVLFRMEPQAKSGVETVEATNAQFDASGRQVHFAAHMISDGPDLTVTDWTFNRLSVLWGLGLLSEDQRFLNELENMQKLAHERYVRDLSSRIVELRQWRSERKQECLDRFSERPEISDVVELLSTVNPIVLKYILIAKDLEAKISARRAASPTGAVATETTLTNSTNTTNTVAAADGRRQRSDRERREMKAKLQMAIDARRGSRR